MVCLNSMSSQTNSSALDALLDDLLGALVEKGSHPVLGGIEILYAMGAGPVVHDDDSIGGTLEALEEFPLFWREVGGPDLVGIENMHGWLLICLVLVMGFAGRRPDGDPGQKSSTDDIFVNDILITDTTISDRKIIYPAKGKEWRGESGLMVEICSPEALPAVMQRDLQR